MQGSRHAACVLVDDKPLVGALLFGRCGAYTIQIAGALDAAH